MALLKKTPFGKPFMQRASVHNCISDKLNASRELSNLRLSKNKRGAECGKAGLKSNSLSNDSGGRTIVFPPKVISSNRSLDISGANIDKDGLARFATNAPDNFRIKIR